VKANPFYVFYRPITARGVLTTERAVRFSTFLTSR